MGFATTHSKMRCIVGLALIELGTTLLVIQTYASQVSAISFQIWHFENKFTTLENSR